MRTPESENMFSVSFAITLRLSSTQLLIEDAEKIAWNVKFHTKTISIHANTCFLYLFYSSL